MMLSYVRLLRHHSEDFFNRAETNLMTTNRRHNSQMISWFLDLYERNRLNLNPPYQRPYQRRSIWDQAFKNYFIDTNCATKSYCIAA
jgi:hypothetical protein